jgi:hypothetical protein
LPQRRIVVAAGSAITAVLLAAIFLAVASANSVPGDWLYGLKQFGNSVAYANAPNATGKAQVAVQQLQTALVDLRTEVTNQRSDADVKQAIAIVVTYTQNAQLATDSLPAGSDRDASQSALESALSDEQATLHNILNQRDWSLRLICTQQLGALGEVIPQITNVQITPSGVETSRITITGTHFSTGAQVYINGRPLRVAPTATATTLTVLAVGYESDDLRTVGVLNPDSTATEFILRGSSFSNQGTPPPDDGGHGTPEPGE